MVCVPTTKVQSRIRRVCGHISPFLHPNIFECVMAQLHLRKCLHKCSHISQNSTRAPTTIVRSHCDYKKVQAIMHYPAKVSPYVISTETSHIRFKLGLEHRQNA